MTRSLGVGGLSAVAVLALVAYGADPTLLQGGFAGVDALFVVVGYLAARSIVEAEAAGRFSLGGFYGVLLRRTAPAMLAMLAPVSAAVWTLWPAQAFADYCLTLAAAAVFAANLAFAEITGFFGPFARAQPLLHLWSLGVAAQVLLALPLVRLAARRVAPDHVRLTLIVLTVVSYWAGVWGEITATERAWYLPHMRAWEILIGALLVFGDLPTLRTQAGRAAVALLGLVVLAGVFLFYDSGLRQPGLATLGPVLGAALVIFAGAGGTNPVSAMLEVRPLAALGAAALSVYLWHWPVLVIARSVSPSVMAVAVGLAAVAAAAALSWRFLEQPFREPAGRWRATAFSALGMAALFALAVLGVMA